MPEGPSIVILKEEVQRFKSKRILKASGYSKIDKSLLKDKKVTAFKSWGKHFIICLPHAISIRIHLLLFGKYLINEKKKDLPALRDPIVKRLRRQNSSPHFLLRKLPGTILKKGKEAFRPHAL